MLLKCFKLFYIKDNSFENSVDFIFKKMDPLYAYYSSVVELMIKLIICLAVITFLIPNHIIS